MPAVALIVQSIWVSLLCLTGTYGQLLDYVIFAALIFYVLTTIGLFMLRVKRPDRRASVSGRRLSGVAGAVHPARRGRVA